MSAFGRAARALLIAFLGLFVAGFGVCGAIGTLGGLAGMASHSPGGEPDFSGAMLMCGLVGLAVAFVCWKIVARMRRKSPGFGR